ncbi:MAG: formylglycine-generating enzyme family protein, partial [Bacteroidota bacterium]
MKSSLLFKTYFLPAISFFLVIGFFSACEEDDSELNPEFKIVNPDADSKIIKGAEVKVAAQLSGFDIYHTVHSIEFTINDSTYYHDTTKQQNFSFLWTTDHLNTGEHELNLEVTYSDESLNDKDWNYFYARDLIDEYIKGEEDEPDTIIASNNITVELTESPESNLTNLSFTSFARDTFDYNSKTIILSPFKISKYEITNEQFCSFLNAIEANENGYYSGIKYLHVSNNNEIVYEDGQFKPETNTDSMPVTNVTWYGAKNFCNWAGGRLPTETEWIYCSKETDASNLDDIAWYKDNSDNSIHRIGEKTPNYNDLYDILGNAAEWCMDWYNESMYSSASSDTLVNPTPPKNQSIKVYKGG